MVTTIVVIEDEAALVDILRYNLETAGYNVRTALDGERGIIEVNRSPKPDLVLLDLMLPDISGTEVCRRLRSSEHTRDTPVLMLTARGEEIDRVVGFEVGADDYMIKPFSVRELLLRIKAIIRRTRSKTPQESSLITFGDLTLDIPGHQVFIGGHECALTALEFKLLVVLVQRKGRVQTRDTLLSDVWDMNADITTRTVDTHIKRLREKLDTVGEYIETVRGVGYRFAACPNEKPT